MLPHFPFLDLILVIFNYQNFVRKADGNRIFQEFRMDFFLDGMVASLETLSLIVEGNELKETFMEDPMLKEMKPYLMKLNIALGLVHGKGDFGSTLGIKVEEYDADTEGMDEHKHGKK